MEENMHDLLFVLWYLCKRTMSGTIEAEDVKKGLQMTILEIISSLNADAYPQV